MRNPNRVVLALFMAACIGGTVFLNAQTLNDTDMASVLAAAENQLPRDLDPGSVRIYLDGVAAYIYGYSLISIGTTESVATDVASAFVKTGRSPINQLFRATSIPVGSSYKDVVLPSTTTLYSVGFFNLEAEPLVLHIPTISSDRFFIVQLLDGWTNVSRRSPSSRLTSMTPGDYALIGPGWSGTLPNTLTEKIRFDTNTAWQIMRVYTTGTDEDQSLVANDIFQQMSLTPLSLYGKPYTPPSKLGVNPAIDVLTQPIDQVDNMDACAYFGTMSAMMMSNPARRIDAAIVPSLERLGIISTTSTTPTQFSCAKLRGTQEGQAEIVALQLAVLTGRYILNSTPQPSPTPTNWSMPLNVGDYATRYLLRAIVAHKALGANRTEDAVYAYGTYDSSGTGESNRLFGTNKYMLHFKAQTSSKAPTEIPPIDGNGFWSITMYNADGTLVDNKVLNYNALSTKEVQGHLPCLNSDGSLDIYVQADQPSDPKQFCNWLEAPQPTTDNNGPFILFMRMYWPDAAITNRRNHWYPPGIQKTN